MKGLLFKSIALGVVGVSVFVSSPLWIAFTFIISFILTPLVVILLISFFINARGTINIILLLHHKFTIFKVKYFSSSKSIQNKINKELINGELWLNFCENLKKASIYIMNGPSNIQIQCDGYRYLTRVLRAGLSEFMEYNDQKMPKLHSLVGADNNIFMGADNPDNLYESCPLNKDTNYVLKGLRGTVLYLSFNTQLGIYGDGKRIGMPLIDTLDMNKLKYLNDDSKYNDDLLKHKRSNDDKYFEIIISDTKPSSIDENINWLKKSNIENGRLIVRQTFGDKENEFKAILKLEVYNDDSNDDIKMEPSTLNSEMIKYNLLNTTDLLIGSTLFFAQWANKMRNDLNNINKLPVKDQKEYIQAGGDINIFYYHSYYKIKSDEALIITVKPPNNYFYWNFQLNNHWMESLDYVNYNIHINSYKAKYNKDSNGNNIGYIVITHENNMNKPGLLPATYKNKTVNWLTTINHINGTMLFRWLMTKDFTHPTTELVKLIKITRFN